MIIKRPASAADDPTTTPEVPGEPRERSRYPSLETQAFGSVLTVLFAGLLGFIYIYGISALVVVSG